VFIIKCEYAISILQREYIIYSRTLHLLGYTITITFTQLKVKTSGLQVNIMVP
jgi:hypothetical protein